MHLTKILKEQQNKQNTETRLAQSEDRKDLKRLKLKGKWFLAELSLEVLR